MASNEIRPLVLEMLPHRITTGTRESLTGLRRYDVKTGQLRFGGETTAHSSGRKVTLQERYQNNGEISSLGLLGTALAFAHTTSCRCLVFDDHDDDEVEVVVVPLNSSATEDEVERPAVSQSVRQSIRRIASERKIGL